MKIKQLVAVLMSLCFCFVIWGQGVQRMKIGDLEKLIAESKGPLIVDFWATYCKPCIEEIPYYEEEIKLRAKDSIKMILVSLDLEDYYPKKISEFALKNKFSSRLAWLDEFDADYFCPKIDVKWSGAIPATLFINNTRSYRKFYEAQLPREKLVKEIEAMLGR